MTWRTPTLDKIQHIVVIWRRDGRYGKFSGANGLAQAGDAYAQVDRERRAAGQARSAVPVSSPPFAYFANYAGDTEARALHLYDATSILGSIERKPLAERDAAAHDCPPALARD